MTALAGYVNDDDDDDDDDDYECRNCSVTMTVVRTHE